MRRTGTTIVATFQNAALVSLGYDGLAAGKAVAAVEQAESVESLITAALRKLAK